MSFSPMYESTSVPQPEIIFYTMLVFLLKEINKYEKDKALSQLGSGAERTRAERGQVKEIKWRNFLQVETKMAKDPVPTVSAMAVLLAHSHPTVMGPFPSPRPAHNTCLIAKRWHFQSFRLPSFPFFFAMLIELSNFYQNFLGTIMTNTYVCVHIYSM